MKKHITAVVSIATAGLLSQAGAFTIDPVGYEGTTLTTTAVVIVPGYGSLTFEALEGSEIPVNTNLPNPPSNGPTWVFDHNEVIKITFNGAEPLNVNFSYAGVNFNESFAVSQDTPQAYIVRLTGSPTGEAGLASVSWDVAAVPEPSSALLGLAGTMMLVLRRRR